LHPFRFIKDIVRDKEVLFIDIGANEGASINAAHKNFKLLKKIIAYEPLENSILDTLIEQLKVRNKECTYNIYNKAVGCLDRVDFNITDSAGLNSVFKINPNYNYISSNGQINNIITVPCVTLDSILTDIYFSERSLKEDLLKVLKIDVQGYEYNVLESGALLSNGEIDFLFIELIMIEKYIGQKNYLNIMQLLFDYGFVLLDFRPNFKQTRDKLSKINSFGQYTEADAVYIHKNAIKRLNLELYDS